MTVATPSISTSHESHLSKDQKDAIVVHLRKEFHNCDIDHNDEDNNISVTFPSGMSLNVDISSDTSLLAWYFLSDEYPELSNISCYSGAVELAGEGDDQVELSIKRILQNPQPSTQKSHILNAKPSAGETEPREIYKAWVSYAMEKLTPEERVILTPEGQKEFLRKIPGYTAMKNARDAKGALERFDDKITQKLGFNPKELVDEALKNGKIIPPKK